MKTYYTWYSDAHNYIFDKFQQPELFCDLFAATSVRSMITKNYRVAKRLYNHWMSTGTIDFNAIPLRHHIPNVIRAFNREPLSGNKVSRFAANLRGNYVPVTIDRWICYYFCIPQNSLNRKRYFELEIAIQTHAEKINLWPCELQAELWIRARKMAGYKPITLLDVMRNNEISC